MAAVAAAEVVVEEVVVGHRLEEEAAAGEGVGEGEEAGAEARLLRFP